MLGRLRALANDDVLLSALTPEQRRTLADLLRHLLASFETRDGPAAPTLGFTLEPAITARRRRQAVGLSDTPGLLVAAVEPGSPAEAAGLARGDLIVEADGQPSVSVVALAELLEQLPDEKPLRLTILRGNESRRAVIKRPTKIGPNR